MTMKKSNPNKKILIVEDEEDILQALTDELKRAGFEIFQARNGIEGLEMARQKNPDLILLDIIMPKMDGMAMLKKLREHPWGRDTLVILLTNLSANEKILEGIVENKPIYYLVKSDWKLGKIVEKVKEKLL